MNDLYQRKINYIRISVTDRCNFRCFYCMPRTKQFLFIPHSRILSYEQIVEFLHTASELGIENVRLTGGEPLVRKDIVKLVEMIRKIDKIKDISMTTNGLLFPKYAAALKKAGLNRVNISFDTFQEAKFRKDISSQYSTDSILKAIYKAIELDFSPVKINIILINGFNDYEITDFVSFTKNLDIHLRFIELMPVSSDSQRVHIAGFINNKIVKSMIEAHFGKLEKTNVMGLGPAVNYRLPGFLGSIGFISHISNVFCSTCNRIRLTSNGYIKRCLYDNPGISIKNHLTDRGFLKNLIFSKPPDYKAVLREQSDEKKASMFKIGG